MKPISLVFLCLFAMAPFLLMAEIRSDVLARTLELRSHYDAAIDNALSDASQVLALSVSGNNGYAASSGVSGDAGKAVEAFITSLACGLGASADESGKARVRLHVPVIVSVGPDGAELFSVLPIRGSDGVRLCRTVRLPAVPYAWTSTDGLRIVRFTLGDAIDVAEIGTGVVVSGHWRDMGADLPELATEKGFRSLRTEVVAGVVRSLLESGLEMAAAADAGGPDDPMEEAGMGALAASSVFGLDNGVTTRFDLPNIEDATFRRAVSDVGLLAYVKGMPVGFDRTYDTFAFGGARVVRRQAVAGYMWEQRRIYCRSSCPTYAARSGTSAFQQDSLHWFADSREAAMAGYSACSDCSR